MQPVSYRLPESWPAFHELLKDGIEVVFGLWGSTATNARISIEYLQTNLSVYETGKIYDVQIDNDSSYLVIRDSKVFGKSIYEDSNTYRQHMMDSCLDSVRQ